MSVAPVVTIGGSPFELPSISFVKVRTAMPVLGGLKGETDAMAVRGIVLRVVAIFLGIAPERLEEDISYIESTVVMGQLGSLLDWAGLVREEAAPGEAEAISSLPSASTI
jgi:hypothetical protein